MLLEALVDVPVGLEPRLAGLPDHRVAAKSPPNRRRIAAESPSSHRRVAANVYGLAIFDCRSDINALILICDRRADLLRSKDEAATRKSQQDLVNAAALSSKPEKIPF